MSPLQKRVHNVFRSWAKGDTSSTNFKSLFQKRSCGNLALTCLQVSKGDQVAGEFYMLDWTREVDTHEAYIAALDFVIKFYNSNSSFRQDVARSTAKVLGKDVACSEESDSGQISLEYLLILLCGEKSDNSFDV